MLIGCRRPTTAASSKCRLPSSSVSVAIWVRSANLSLSAARKKASSFQLVVILEQVIYLLKYTLVTIQQNASWVMISSYVPLAVRHMNEGAVSRAESVFRRVTVHDIGQPDSGFNFNVAHMMSWSIFYTNCTVLLLIINVVILKMCTLARMQLTVALQFFFNFSCGLVVLTGYM